MKLRSVIVFYMLLNGCGNLDKNEHLDFKVELNNVFINQYQNDSLNVARPYVIPKVYFDFDVFNSSPDSVIFFLNTHFNPDTDELPYLYLCFEYSGRIDTLLLTDYESVNPLIFTPNSVDRFIVGVPINDYLKMPLYKQETGSTFMKYLADHGVIYYNNPNPKGNNATLTPPEITKSRNFVVVFRDPEDTTVE